MINAFFNQQIKRLVSTFGEKAFSEERVKLIWANVHDLPENSFTKIVNHMISTFKVPPLPKDFQDAARGERNAHSDYRAVPVYMAEEFKGDGGLARVLEKDFKGCKTVGEAIELQRFRNRIKQADNEPDGAA